MTSATYMMTRCQCVPPNTLMAKPGETARCGECGAEIVFGVWAEPEPTLRLLPPLDLEPDE